MLFAFCLLLGACGEHSSAIFGRTSDAVTSPGALTLTTPLAVNLTSFQPGGIITGTVTYTNSTSADVPIQRAVITSRAPGSTTYVPGDDFAPGAGATVVKAGQTLTLAASRKVGATDAAGNWTAYSSYQDSAGGWHSSPTLTFAVYLPPSGNLITTAPVYAAPGSDAQKQADAWRVSRPGDAAQMDKIAKGGQAAWFGDWNTSIQANVASFVNAAVAANRLPVMVVYNIPQRDCGLYSAGGATSAAAYNTWIRSFQAGIGARSAVVVLEPDALSGMDCLNAADQAQRIAVLADAVTVLSSATTAVYIDAGHSTWKTSTVMAQRLNSVNVSKARGFSLNVSNFLPTEGETTYGVDIATQLGGSHFVIDTSRNGLGTNGQWCNPLGRALGVQATVTTTDPTVDAYLWVKSPGKSDGTCNGGPAAGTFWPDYALGLAQRAAY